MGWGGWAGTLRTAKGGPDATSVLGGDSASGLASVGICTDGVRLQWAVVHAVAHARRPAVASLQALNRTQLWHQQSCQRPCPFNHAGPSGAVGASPHGGLPRCARYAAGGGHQPAQCEEQAAAHCRAGCVASLCCVVCHPCTRLVAHGTVCRPPALPSSCPAIPPTVPMLCCTVCRWALQHMLWTPYCFTWSAATRRLRLLPCQAANQRRQQQQRQQQLLRCTQSTPPVSRGCTNYGSVAVCSPAQALHRPGLQAAPWQCCAPNSHACPC